MFNDARQHAAAATVWTVQQVNQRAKELLEQQFFQVRIQGEISNLRLDRSGHRYFSLKDASGVLSAALFRQRTGRLTFTPQDGAQVVATGTVTIYGPQGRYQLMVSHLEQAGAGALQAAYERLRQQLLSEGLFDAGRKRPLALLPRRVAVLTSPTGSVWRDILHVSLRRFAGAPLLLVPVPVQGVGAAPALVRALGQVAQLHQELHIDVVILARGGGSLEDLAAFNDEALARAIHACPVPVVSAVGHETDTTIADFVADVRAPTPSAAAERVFAEKRQLQAQLLQGQARLRRAIGAIMQHARLRLRVVRQQLGDGRKLCWQPTQRLAALERRLVHSCQRQLARRREQLRAWERRLQALHPRQRLARLEARRGRGLIRIERGLRRQLQQVRARLATASAKLSALSPLAVLGRGYAIVQRADGTALRQIAQAPAGTALQVRLSDGTVAARSLGPLAEP